LEFEAMRPLAVLLTVVIGVSALSGTIWLARYSPIAEKPKSRELMRWESGTGEAQEAQERIEAQKKAKAIEEHQIEVKKLEEKKPPLADKPPFPKAQTGERVFEFGTMGVNEEKKHKFQIKNQGQGPLLIAKGPTNCKCTISNISQSTIPPGKSAEIEMSWTPRETTSTFAKTATIWTNDAELPQIDFKVFGKVAKVFVVQPERNWHAGHITDVQDGHTSGIVASAMSPDFKILSIESPDPHVKVDYHPLKQRDKIHEGYKSGYKFDVTVNSGIPPGHLRAPLKIHTSLEGNITVDVEVTATRSGPILFLPPMGNSRTYWNAEKSLLNMGSFPHETGSKVVLPALLYGLKEKFQIIGVEKDADFVRVSVEPNAEIGGTEQQGIRLIFEVPPGAPPVTRIAPGGVHMTLKTNHPKLKELTFQVEFVSR
jgi:Protein of unknown function (DUF1573)